jgi:hypothetical protein
MPLPGYKVREIIQKLMVDGDRNKDGKISFNEFVYVSISKSEYENSLLFHCMLGNKV